MCSYNFFALNASGPFIAGTNLHYQMLIVNRDTKNYFMDIQGNNLENDRKTKTIYFIINYN